MIRYIFLSTFLFEAWISDECCSCAYFEKAFTRASLFIKSIDICFTACRYRGDSVSDVRYQVTATPVTNSCDTHISYTVLRTASASVRAKLGFHYVEFVKGGEKSFIGSKVFCHIHHDYQDM